MKAGGRNKRIGHEIIVATYNVHHWIGTDGRRDMQRCLKVLEKTGAVIAGLQEAAAPLWSLGDNAETLAVATGMNAVLGPTLEKRESHFGNVLVTSYPVLDVRRHDISISGKEPRGVLDADVDVEGLKARVLVTHFGLRSRERRKQAVWLCEIIHRIERDVTFILGDFNEWFRLSRTLSYLRSQLGIQDAPGTFPSMFPIFALDRIWVHPKRKLNDIKAFSAAPARLASDHLPLTARVEI